MKINAVSVHIVPHWCKAVSFQKKMQKQFVRTTGLLLFLWSQFQSFVFFAALNLQYHALCGTGILAEKQILKKFIYILCALNS